MVSASANEKEDDKGGTKQTNKTNEDSEGATLRDLEIESLISRFRLLWSDHIANFVLANQFAE